MQGHMDVKYKIFVWKSEAKKSCPIPVKNSRIVFEEIQCDGVGFIHMWVWLVL